MMTYICIPLESVRTQHIIHREYKLFCFTDSNTCNSIASTTAICCGWANTFYNLFFVLRLALFINENFNLQKNIELRLYYESQEYTHHIYIQINHESLLFLMVFIFYRKILNGFLYETLSHFPFLMKAICYYSISNFDWKLWNVFIRTISWEKDHWSIMNFRVNSLWSW